MKTLHKKLSKLEGKLLKIERNTETGKYELTVGIPKAWAYESSDEIEIEEITKTKTGALLKIFSEDEDIVIDDLIEFTNIIIDTNEEIAKKQEEFERKMDETRKQLEEQVTKFHDELEEMKKSKFKQLKKETDAEPKESKPPKKEKEDKKDVKKELEDKLTK